MIGHVRKAITPQPPQQPHFQHARRVALPGWIESGESGSEMQSFAPEKRSSFSCGCRALHHIGNMLMSRRLDSGGLLCPPNPPPVHWDGISGISAASQISNLEFFGSVCFPVILMYLAFSLADSFLCTVFFLLLFNGPVKCL